MAKVAKGRLGVSQAYIDSADTDLIYEEGPDVEDDLAENYRRNLPKTLAQLPGKGIRNGTAVTVSDEAQQFSVTVYVVHKAGLGLSRLVHLGAGMPAALGPSRP